MEEGLATYISCSTISFHSSIHLPLSLFFRLIPSCLCSHTPSSLFLIPLSFAQWSLLHFLPAGIISFDSTFFFTSAFQSLIILISPNLSFTSSFSLHSCTVSSFLSFSLKCSPLPSIIVSCFLLLSFFPFSLNLSVTDPHSFFFLFS